MCDWLGWFTIWSPWKIPMSASSSVHMSFSRRDSLQRSTAVRTLFTFVSVRGAELFPIIPSLPILVPATFGGLASGLFLSGPPEFPREF